MSNLSRYDVSIIVATYRQETSKIILTIKSILDQKNVRFQIIVTDDGSEDNHFEELRVFFGEEKFDDYVLLDSDCNQGTVKNFIKGVEASNSDYVKFISPGDLLFGDNVLSEWIECMRSNCAEVSFSDVIYYQIKEDNIELIKCRTAPQDTKIYKRADGRYIKNLVLFNDVWLGAAVLCKTETLKKYLDMIAGKVVLLEDGIYRIMGYDKVSCCHFEKEAIFYEYGVGVASSTFDVKSDIHIKLVKDWKTVSEIILDMPVINRRFEKKFRYFVQWKEKSRISFSMSKFKLIRMLCKELIPLYLHIPEMLVWHIKIFLFKRSSRTNVDINCIKSCFEWYFQNKDVKN